MITLEQLEQIYSAATPGPYKYDCGNGDVESEHNDYRRVTICERADLRLRHNDYEDRNLDKSIMMSPDSDMEWIAEGLTALPTLIKELKAARAFIDNFGVDTFDRLDWAKVVKAAKAYELTRGEDE